MRQFIIRDLKPAVRERLLKEGYVLTDRADIAIPYSSLAPRKLGEEIQLAIAAGVTHAVVASWMKHKENIQEERLTLLGGSTRIYATANGHVGTREHVLAALQLT